MNNLVGVSMPRGSTTQTRTFFYDDLGHLTSSTNPESGTTTYTYGTNNLVASKTDAKGATTTFGYDGGKRLGIVSHFPTGAGGAEDVCQRVTYTYGTDATSFDYTYNRLFREDFGTLIQSCTPGVDPQSFRYQYEYNVAGRVTNKYLLMQRMMAGVALGGTPAVSQTYSASGKVVGKAYQGNDPYASGTGTYPGLMSLANGYDSMDRLASVTNANGMVHWVQNVAFDEANRITNMQYPEFSASTPSYVTETHMFNVMGQMTQMNWAQGSTNSAYPSGSIQYVYSSTQNNGQISQAVDSVSGETISYQYDALKRLTSASATPNAGATPAAWTQTFQYDGFGNLTSKVLNGTTTTIAVDPATNRLTSSYDANGNMTSGAGDTITYDGSNRIASVAPTSGGTEYFVYDPENRPVYHKTGLGAEEVTLYGIQGEKLATYNVAAWCDDPDDPDTCYFGLNLKSTSVWFGGKLIWSGTGTYVATGPIYADRVGSNRTNGARYYPYGEEIGTATTNDHEKFGTYTRSSFSGLDYANQRYYASSYGRFNTADQYQALASGANDPNTPLSWNKYAYVGGDPVNRYDPSGQMWAQGPPCNIGDDDPGSCDDDGGAFGFYFYQPTNGGGGSGGGAGGGGGSTAPPPTCSVDLFTRPVTQSLGIGSHSYLEVWGSLGEETLEGGPTNNGSFFSPGVLTRYITPNGVFYPDDTYHASPANAIAIPCTEANLAIQDATNFSTTATYDPFAIFGPNSNSFMHWLLLVSGLTSLYPDAPWGSFGWNYGSILPSQPPLLPLPAPGATSGPGKSPPNLPRIGQVR
jgi:RHS repeat-associated protein